MDVYGFHGRVGIHEHEQIYKQIQRIYRCVSLFALVFFVWGSYGIPSIVYYSIDNEYHNPARILFYPFMMNSRISSR